MATQSMISGVRGMGEVPPSQSWPWQVLQAFFTQHLTCYGYQEIRLPLLERTELFQRGIGQATDIIEKEMYTFEDRGGESLSLRPEGTAGCVRAAIEYGLLYHQTQKLFYWGPMFRYERPQKGRLRQFHQLGVEAFGFKGPELDAEMLAMSFRFFKALKIDHLLELQINSLGLPEERLAYRGALVEYFSQHQNQLDEDSKRRLTTNPLRILDSKNPEMAQLIKAAPQMMEFLGEESRTYFEKLTSFLTQLNIPYRIVPTLVRGLDYYTHLVFEWVTTALGSQGAVCAGGRYDRLVEEFGGAPTPAIGFGLGLERLILLLEIENSLEKPKNPELYLVVLGEGAFPEALRLSETLRNDHPKFQILLHCEGSSAKNQFKRADKSGATLALVLGESEIEQQTIVVKFLREDKDQVVLNQSELSAWLGSYFKGE